MLILPCVHQKPGESVHNNTIKSSKAVNSRELITNLVHGPHTNSRTKHTRTQNKPVHEIFYQFLTKLTLQQSLNLFLSFPR